MRNSPGLSGVALAVLALATAPASALDLNLGGGSDNGGSTISIGGADSDALVDIDTGGAIAAGGNDLVDLDSASNPDAVVDLNLGSGDDGDDGGVIELNDNDVLDLGGDGILDGEGDVTVDLFGPGAGGKTQLAVGTDGEGEDDAIVTLFGTGGESDLATANILPQGVGGGTGDLGLDDVTLDLFGPGDRGAGGNGPGGSGAGGNGGPAGGGTTDPTLTGSISGDGSSGGDGAGTIFNPPRQVGAGNGARVAASGQARVTADCFFPDATQVAHLLDRSTYTASVTASWQNAASVDIVPVRLCPDARATIEAAIAADADAGLMRTAVAGNARIMSELRPSYGPGDVLAVDGTDGGVRVYVY